MAFKCTTRLLCDCCSKAIETENSRMSDCIGRLRLELYAKEERGWVKMYGYNVCKECHEHYGTKYLRRMLKGRKETLDCD